MLDPLHPEALEIAAERSGLTKEQVAAALTAYRYVNSQMPEPDWTAVSHMSGRFGNYAVYAAEGTEVTFQLFTPRTAPMEFGPQEQAYCFEDKPYETFGEARAAEFRAAALKARSQSNG